MYLVKTPKIIQRLFPQFIWNFSSKERVIYLTFDDGPVPEITEYILDVLEKYNAKATFFCVGENVVKHQQTFNRIKKDGHAVGNHGYSHLSGWKTDNQTYIQDVNHSAQFINSDLFRPPYGRIKRSQAKSLSSDFGIVMWDVLSGDFDPNQSVEDCFNNIISATKNGSIIVMHDSLKTKDKVKELLPLVLQYYSKRKFRFKAISQSKMKARKIA